jgi:hypothetical protein
LVVIGTRIHLSRKNKALPVPFQRDNLKQGLRFSTGIPFTLLKENSIFPKKHPDMDLVYSEVFNRIYSSPEGSPSMAALDLFLRSSQTTYTMLALNLEKCQTFMIRQGRDGAEVTLHVSKNESYPNIKFHKQFYHTYTAIEQYIKALYKERPLANFDQSPFWSDSPALCLFLYVQSRPGRTWNISEFGPLAKDYAVQLVIYPHDPSFSPRHLFRPQASNPSYLMQGVITTALYQEGEKVWEWVEEYLRGQDNWWGLAKVVEDLLGRQGEEASFFLYYRNWDDIGLTQVLLAHLRRYPTVENLKFLRVNQEVSKDAARAYQEMKSALNSMTGEISLSLDDHQGELSPEEKD